MGNTSVSGLLDMKFCAECVKAFYIHIDNPCRRFLCLRCYWRHYKNCVHCQQRHHEDPVVSEWTSELKHLKAEFDELRNENVRIQMLCDAANQRYERELMEKRTLFGEAKDNEIAHLRRELKNEEAMCNGLAVENVSLKDQLWAEKKKHDQLVQQLQSELNHAKATCLGLSTENVSLKHQISGRRNTSDQLIQQLRNELAQVKSLCNGHAAEVATLKERNLAEEAKSEQVMEQQNEQLKRKTDQCVQLNHMLMECRDTVKERDTLIAQQSQQLEDVSQLHVRLNHVETVNRQLTCKVRQLEADKAAEPSRKQVSVIKRYFMQMSVDDSVKERVVIETYPESAPNVCRLFHKLISGIEGSYSFSQVTAVKADGYVVIPEAKTKSGDPLPLYAADYNDLEVKRGAVGMRVQSFAPNDVHLIGSQFSIAVGPTKDPLFSHVFGYVVEGLTVCDAICRMDPSQHRIVVADCGEMEPKMLESLMN